jgi:hypothetical protein
LNRLRGTTEGKLHFDHRDKSTKRFDVGTFSTRLLSEVVEELELCDVRCSPCHHRRHGREVTHCPRGHAYTEDNTIIVTPKGGRYCRSCDREQKHKARQGLRRVGVKVALRWRVEGQ